jgi:2,4-dienoyl-CoA reductase-like NADH-dependent reductase (Old Yellow Enzyme family)
LKKVHAKGGLMYLQAFHAGRTTHPSLNGGLEPWAPSSIPNREKIAALKNASYPTPKELTLEEIETLK